MGKALNDPKRMRFGSSEFYVKSPAEMIEAFRPWSTEAVRNSAVIAERVQPGVILDTGPKIPTFPVPEGAGTPDEYLESLAAEGLLRRLEPHAAGRARHRREEYDERLA